MFCMFFLKKMCCVVCCVLFVVSCLLWCCCLMLVGVAVVRYVLWVVILQMSVSLPVVVCFGVCWLWFVVD